jgi:FkbM family methyltransferase
MSKIKIFLGSAKNLTQLLASNHSKKNKIKIFKKWIKLYFKFFLLSKNCHGNERFEKYKLNAPYLRNTIALFDEIFMRNEYNLKLNTSSPVIFDCGANLGFATIFFNWIYPKSKIFSFEPEPRTYALLKDNILKNKLSNVKIHNKALSLIDGKIAFFSGDSPGSLGASINKNRGGNTQNYVDSIKLSNFIKNNDIQKIDLIKMDIEGAEIDVIKDLSESGKLTITNNFIIEYHHKIGGNQKSKLSSFLKTFEDHGFEYQISASYKPLNSRNKFQDILIYFYK